MIHQFIFAGPKPGLSSQAFCSYWVNFHAIDFASKIAQIRQYLIATRIEFDIEPKLPFYQGVAEIWLKNEEEQLASLQSQEFLQGARIDEPRWAAFWQTLAVDTDSVTVQDRPNIGLTNIYVLSKRIPKLTKEDYRKQLLDQHSKKLLNLPKIVHYTAAFARDALYVVGEPRIDSVEVLGFNDLTDLQNAWNSDVKQKLDISWKEFVRNDCWFKFAAKENWIIKPGTR